MILRKHFFDHLSFNPRTDDHQNGCFHWVDFDLKDVDDSDRLLTRAARALMRVSFQLS